MAISKQDARKVKHAVLSGDERTSPTIDASHPSYDFEITGPTQKFTVQGSGDLAYTYDVSANGATFSGSATSVAATAMSTYPGTHVVAVVRITRVSGSGKVTLLAV